jgi:hypothetical protein
MIKREMTINIIINRLLAGILFSILCCVTLFVTSRHFVNQEVTSKWFGLIAGVGQKKQELIYRANGINVSAPESRTGVKLFNKIQPRQDRLSEFVSPKNLLPP